MPDKVFIDTNILLYFVGNESEKRKLSENIVYSDSIKYISTQVINEFLNVSYKKNLSSDKELISLVNDFVDNFEVCLVHNQTIFNAINLKNTYNYSFYDTLIVSTAIENDCRTLYSEDMQLKQIIDGSLTIFNPFA